MTIHALSLTVLSAVLTPTQERAPAPPVELVTTFGWGDFDADGLPDVYAMRREGPDRLYRNLGDGELQDVTARAGLPLDARSRRALWHDVDGDGDLDLFLSRVAGGSALFRNDGHCFADVTPDSGIGRVTGDALDVRFLDYDRDGRGDLHVLTAEGTRLFRNMTGTRFEEVLPLGGVPTASAASLPVGPVVTAAPNAEEEGPAPAPDDPRGVRGARRPGPRGPAGGTSASAAMGSTAGRSAASTGSAQAASGLDQLCADSVEDLATGGCLPASSTPLLGALFPLSVDFNLDGAGRVGFGTTSPSAQVEVAGGQPVIRLDRDSSPAARTDLAEEDWSFRVTKVSSGPESVIELNPQGSPSAAADVRLFRTVSTSGVKRMAFYRGDGSSTVDAQIGVDGASSYFQRNGGFFGIGTSAPSALLHVSGGGRFDDDVRLADPLGSTSNLQLDMTGGYGLFRDAIGAGSSSTRLWLDAPDGGELVLGPRSGASFLDNARLRSEVFTVETQTGGANTLRVDGDAVGINTAAPGSRLHVEGDPAETALYAHAPANVFTGGTAVEGIADGSSSTGVRGVSTNTSGPGYGVHAESHSSTGRALFAENHSTTGTNMAVYAIASSTGGRALFGTATSTTGTSYGAYGSSSSTSGRGVFGGATATSGAAYGVYGRTNSTSGAGVYGVVDATTGGGFGILGETRGNASGAAIQASSLFSTGVSDGLRASTDSPSGWAVWGAANTAGGRGVVGQAPSGNSALHANGDLTVTGVKNFVQAHPTDPSKEIRFVCLEGNESGTYFRGTGRVVDGECVIEVPEDFRLVTAEEGMTVQLTARGPAHLWYERADLDEVVVRGSADCEFDYFVNGVRRGYEDFETLRDNESFVPRFRGVPFGAGLSPELRRRLVENGVLNPDFTPNEATAAQLGWTLHAPRQAAGETQMER